MTGDPTPYSYTGTSGCYYQCPMCQQWVNGVHYCVPYSKTYTYQTTFPQGWECPKCHRVNGPSVATCPCYEPVFLPNCGICHAQNDLTEHGSKHICRKCKNDLIDSALSETEGRERANQQ
jgi:hypothetical protein